MVKEKHPNPDEAGDHSKDVTILNADGSVQHRYKVSETHEVSPDMGVTVPDLTEMSPGDLDTSPPPGMIATGALAGAVPHDTSPALVKRLNAEAAQSAEDEADDLADAIHAKFMALLTSTITDKGGNLTMDDVAEMGEAFTAQLDGIKETFLSAVESYSQAREQNRVSSERGNVFHRIMIHPFEQRLLSEKELKEKPHHLSRRMLPGFYSVLSMMFGPPKLARYEEKAKLAVDRLLRESNGQIEWVEVYRSSGMRQISLRSQIDIARHFVNVEKRLDWMVAMVNSNLIPLEDGKLSAGWLFTREAAEALLSDLFHNLRAALQNQSARQKFTDELGAETVTILDTVCRRFS